MYSPNFWRNFSVMVQHDKHYKKALYNIYSFIIMGIIIIIRGVSGTGGWSHLVRCWGTAPLWSRISASRCPPGNHGILLERGRGQGCPWSALPIPSLGWRRKEILGSFPKVWVDSRKERISQRICGWGNAALGPLERGAAPGAQSLRISRLGQQLNQHPGLPWLWWSSVLPAAVPRPARNW